MQRSRRGLPGLTWRSGVALVTLAIGSAILAVWVTASIDGTVWGYLERKQHVGCYLGTEGESSGEWICGDGMSKILPTFVATGALATGLFLLGCAVLVFARRARLYRRMGVGRSGDTSAVVFVSVIALIAATAVVYAVVALSGPRPLVDLGIALSTTSTSGQNSD